MNSRLKYLSLTLILAVAVGSVMALTGGQRATIPEKMNSFLTSLKTKLEQRQKVLPEDKVYLHFDKPFYKPGEDIWFSAYLREGEFFQKSEKSDILQVELINPKGGVAKTIKLVAEEGKARGDFHLDADLPGGLYKVRASTQWQKNDPNPYIYEKELQVQKVVLPRLKMNLDFEREAFGAGEEVQASLKLESNANEALTDYEFNCVATLNGQTLKNFKASTNGEGKADIRFELPANLSSNDGLLNVMIQYQGLTESISRSIPILLNKMDLHFYPEGGDLVEGMASRVAFRAVNEFGKPADVQGVVLDDEGNTVSTFRSYHQGMGAFELTPREGKEYSVKITQPAGATVAGTLPEALPKGYAMKIEPSAKGVDVTLRSSEPENLNLAIQMRGKMLWASEIKLEGNSKIFRLHTYDMPAGVAQFTLFDKNGIARAERLAYLNKGRQLKVDVKTDKEKYLPREKVRMDLRVTDERGIPMPAQLSMAVVNDQLLSFADDKSGNILSELLLQQDIKEKVHEPSFYFNPKEAKADEALDYLLMTAGWRRFTWDQVTKENPQVRYQGERAILAGQVLDAYSYRPVPYASLTLDGLSYGMLTDANGRFRLEGLDITQNPEISVGGGDYQETKYPLTSYTESLTYYVTPKIAVRQDNNFWGVEEAMDEDIAMEAPAEADFGGVEHNEVVVQRAAGVKRNKGGAFKRKAMAAPGVMNNRARNIPQPAVAAVVAANGDLNNADGIEPQPDLFKDKKEEAKADLGGLMDKEIMVLEEEKVVDDRFKALEVGERMAIKNAEAGPVYYRAREFAAPVYKDRSGEAPHADARNDFRSTLHWAPLIEVGRNGKARVEFYASDEITSFRAVVEGIGATGDIAHAEHQIYTQLPFSMAARLPIETATDDILNIPLTLTNNTGKAMSGKLDLQVPEALKAIGSLPGTVSIPAGQSKTLYLNYRVLHQPGEAPLQVAFQSQGHSDAVSQNLKIVPKGFPVSISMSGDSLNGKFAFRIQDMVNGSLTAKFTAFPSVVSDLLTGIESILREPFGCFEQTSMSSYPNVMVMNYLKSNEGADPAIMARSAELLDKGYKRLVTFETPNKGYEWFGSNPPHEALTAYGLMQFNDMKDVYDKVDQSMIDRTSKWLMSRRDGKGGFKRDPKALDSFGRASAEVTNAYIVYSLSEAGYTDMKVELDAAYTQAKSSKDPYQLALVAAAMYNLKDASRGAELLSLLKAKQEKDGSFAAKQSITCSGGVSLKVETTSLAAMAMMKAGHRNHIEVGNAIRFVMGSRSGYGGFGSTQGTILALKSLTQFAEYSRRTTESGTIEILVDGKKVGEKQFASGEKEAIELEGLEKFLAEGIHQIEVRYKGCETALPYAIAVDYHTSLPNSSAECVVALDTKLSATEAKMGETLRLSAKLVNKTDKGQPMTMAILGIPAGLSAQPWQLKELQEKKVIDFYEVTGNNVVCYYRQMVPGETREINLDLKADIPGEYDAPASSAYLYYTAEYKDWKGLPRVTVHPN